MFILVDVKYMLFMIISLFIIPLAYADTWDLSEDNTISISIIDNQYTTQERIHHIQYTINTSKQKDNTFAG